jgi:ATP-dependent Lon protease
VGRFPPPISAACDLSGDMADFEQISFRSDQFSGVARLFPLPNLVLFPHVMQPLHVFEPRYRELVEEALDGDRLMALSLLSPGWEKDYEGRPPVYPTACLSMIAKHTRLEDGRYNLLLVGVRRIQITRELPPKKPFRLAEATIAEDEFPKELAPARPALQRRLIERFRGLLPQVPEAREQLEQLLREEVPLGILTDIMSYTLDLDVAVKIKLLAEPNVDRRAETLIELLSQATAGRSRFPGGWPPKFSEN